MPNTFRLIALPLLIFSQLGSQAGFAYESRFGIDPALVHRLDELARRKITVLTSSRQGELYTVEASAVLSVDAAKIFAAAQDYDRYVEFGMPHLDESHRVEEVSPGLMYVFSSMTYSPMTSSQYMEVRVHNTLMNGAMGMEWELTQKRAAWPYEQSSAFSRMDGSFYVEPLASGNVYVRYFLANEVDVPMAGLFGGVIQNALRAGAGDVLMVLARQARLKHK